MLLWLIIMFCDIVPDNDVLCYCHIVTDNYVLCYCGWQSSLLVAISPGDAPRVAVALSVWGTAGGCLTVTVAFCKSPTATLRQMVNRQDNNNNSHVALYPIKLYYLAALHIINITIINHHSTHTPKPTPYNGLGTDKITGHQAIHCTRSKPPP